MAHADSTIFGPKAPTGHRTLSSAVLEPVIVRTVMAYRRVLVETQMSGLVRRCGLRPLTWVSAAVWVARWVCPHHRRIDVSQLTVISNTELIEKWAFVYFGVVVLVRLCGAFGLVKYTLKATGH